VKENLIKIVESLIFASDVPLPATKLKEIIEGVSIKEIKEAVSAINDCYQKNGNALVVIEIAGGYQISTQAEYAPYIQKLYKGRNIHRLTQRALETLAIIAYKQPITKHEIEAIRGVNVDGVVRTLLERKLITIEGRQKAPGNPLLYATTKFFLQYFGLKTLDSLPKLKEIDELLKDDEKFLESLDQVALKQLAPEKLGLKNAEELIAQQTELEISEKSDEVDSQNVEKNSNDKAE
jgi:segregation and condensation protein B